MEDELIDDEFVDDDDVVEDDDLADDSEADGEALPLDDEASYACDACGEEIVVPIDLSAGGAQEYVEDCPVCCRPNLIHVELEEDGHARVWAERE